MGGSIRVIIVKDKIVTKKTRWTNSLPSFVQDSNFIDCKKEWVDEYINSPSDYTTPQNDFSPEGYGLDVFDFDKKIIYSCQGYCSYKAIDFIDMLFYEESKEVIKELFSRELLRIQYNFIGEIQTITESFEYFLDKLNYFIDQKHARFIIDWEKTGWTLKKYKETKEQWEEYFFEIQNNYELTESEKEHWNDWINSIEVED